MAPEAYIAHQTAERMRIKIPGMKGNSGYFSFLGEKLRQCQGIRKVAINPTTASVLLIMEAAPEAIETYSRAHDLFQLNPLPPQPQTLSRSVFHAFDHLDLELRKATGGGMNLSELAFVALSGMGLYQLALGNVAAPAWYVAFWYAYSVMLTERRPTAATLA